jgi:aspartyl-tRNA(Asn)/glutamyl-tRNA(Gln) amidotransferase subunit C
MEVNKALIERLAGLARLKLSEEEIREFQKDLSHILAFVEELNEPDLEGMEPLEYITAKRNILREDEPRLELKKEEALKNAPLHDSDYFKVPKVLKKK